MYLHCIAFVYLYNHNIARQRIALLREKQSGSERSPTETRIMVHPPPSHLAQLQTNDQIMKNTDESLNKDTKNFHDFVFLIFCEQRAPTNIKMANVFCSESE